jgi:hypothetical protein
MIIEQIIQEAQNYEGMFNDILKVSPDLRLREQIKQDVNWARKTLRKNDRIVWFLRWSKAWYQSSGGIVEPSRSGALQQYNRRFQTTYVAGDLSSPQINESAAFAFPGPADPRDPELRFPN